MLIWGLAAASVVFWAMRLVTTTAPIPEGTRLAMNGPLAGGDLSRLLGAPRVEAIPVAAPGPAAASRFRLTGIVSTNNSRSHDGGRRGPGVALISIDGAPVRAYRVGDALDSQFSLWSVALRSARIGDPSGTGTEAFVLELPAPAAPATGTLASAGAPLAPTAAVPGPAAGYSSLAGFPQPATVLGNPAASGVPPAFAPPAPSIQPADGRSGNAPGGAVLGIEQSNGSLAPVAPSGAKQGNSNSAVLRQ